MAESSNRAYIYGVWMKHNLFKFCFKCTKSIIRFTVIVAEWCRCEWWFECKGWIRELDEPQFHLMMLYCACNTQLGSKYLCIQEYCDLAQVFYFFFCIVFYLFDKLLSFGIVPVQNFCLWVQKLDMTLVHSSYNMMVLQLQFLGISKSQNKVLFHFVRILASYN